MKTITIDGREYDIDCNALTYIKYRSFFQKSGLIEDLQFIQDYLIKQEVFFETLIQSGINKEEANEETERYMLKETDDFIIKITQITWMLIYSANDKIEEYEKWLKGIKKFAIDDNWIVEVAEYAVNCFCR